MIVTILTERTINDIYTRAFALYQPAINFFELRLDYLTPENLEDLTGLADLLQNLPCPVILTLRPEREGGVFLGSESERLLCLKKLMALQPAYIDIEHDVPAPFLTGLQALSPKTEIIRSYHHFKETPENLSDILHKMQHPVVQIYKCVTMAKTSLDSVRVLLCLQQLSKSQKLIMHCMGETGFFSRILGAVLGNYWTYTTESTSVLSAQLTALDLDTFLSIYRGESLNLKTEIYALLGNPVAHSLGAIFHNAQFKKAKKNAVYVKIALNPEEIEDFFTGITPLPFKGFSVTTPLKECILSIVTKKDPAVTLIGSANTLKCEAGTVFATHTDGAGTVDVIKSETGFADFQNLNVLLLGAGGAARALALAIHSEHCKHLTIVNRTPEKILFLAEKLSATVFSLEEFKKLAVEKSILQYDIIVNTIPSIALSEDELFELLLPYLLPQSVYLALDYQERTVGLQERLRNIGCRCIAAEAMFFAQAYRQLAYWGIG